MTRSFLLLFRLFVWLTVIAFIWSSLVKSCSWRVYTKDVLLSSTEDILLSFKIFTQLSGWASAVVHQAHEHTWCTQKPSDWSTPGFRFLRTVDIEFDSWYRKPVDPSRRVLFMLSVTSFWSEAVRHRQLVVHPPGLQVALKFLRHVFSSIVAS